MSDLEINIVEDALSPLPSPTNLQSPFHLSPEHGRCLKQTRSFTLCSDLIDYFDNKFVHRAHDILEELRAERSKASVASRVNSLCVQMNSLNEILTSLQQDLIKQLLKNVDFELRIFNDRIHKANTQDEVNRYCIDIIQQLVFLLESIMQAEQKDFLESNDLIDIPAIANLESHVFDEEWRKYLKPRNFSAFHLSPQRSCSLSMARKSIDLRRSMLAENFTINGAELRAPGKPNKSIHASAHRDSDGYGSSTSSSSRPASQDIEEYISVEELNNADHMRIFSTSTASLDSGFQNDQQFPFLPQLELQEWRSTPYARSTFSLNSASTESDEDGSNELNSLPPAINPTESVTLGKMNAFKRGTLKRDRRGSSMEMGIALEYIKFRVSTAKKHQVVSRQTDIDVNKCVTFVIQVESNMEDIVPHNFAIIRTFEEFQSFYLDVLNKHGKIDNYPKQLKSSIKTKNFERKIDDILNALGRNSQTRNADYLIKFIKMDNGLVLATDGIDKELQVEKTFFTPSKNDTPGTTPLREVSCRPTNSHQPSVRKELDKNGTLKREPPAPTSPPPADTKTINRVKQGGREVLITTTERNHEFIDAATLEILVENLTTLDQSRDNSRVPDPNFIQQFILGHRHFLKNEEFLSILLKKFKDINENNSMKDQPKTWQMLAKIRILNVIIQWIETFFPDFYTSPEMMVELEKFIENLKEMNEAKSSIQRMQKIIHEQHSYFDSKIGSNDRRLSKNPSVLLGTTLLSNHKFKAEFIAQQLSLIQMDLFKKVGFYEICIKILEGNNSKKNGICTPNLDAFITRSNQESTWVMSEILFAETTKVRIEVTEMAISVAKHCYRLKNYNTLMAILASLQNRLVNRTKVINDINEKSKTTFEKLKRVMDFSGNFKNYRQETRKLLSEDNKPCVPFFALYMKDFTHMNENKKYVGDGLINFSKIRSMHKCLIELKKLQRFPYVDLKEDSDLNIRVLNLYTLSDEKLEDISHKFTKKIS